MFRRLKHYQVVVDVLIAAFYFVLAYFVHPLGSDSVGILAFGFAVAIGFRRISPALSLAVAWTAAFVQMFWFHLPPGLIDFAILAVMYAVALYGVSAIRWTGFASIFAGAVLGAAYIMGMGGRTLVSLSGNLGNLAGVLQLGLQFVFYFGLILVLLGLPWTAGNLLRVRVVAARSQHAQAEAERDAELAEQDVIIEQERNRIARDMHDVVAHSLAVVIAQADGARYARASDPDAIDGALNSISSTAREALADVRLLLGQLRHSQGEGPQPGLADLDRLLDQLRASGLTVSFASDGEVLPFGVSQQLAVYRIVQEALTNALRHGDVSREAVVHFAWTAHDLEMTITNSLDSSPKTAELRVGHGLAGMRERAALVGGDLTTSVTDREFVVTAVIPQTGKVPA
jgi:signal transduction histidine kinase